MGRVDIVLVPTFLCVSVSTGGTRRRPRQKVRREMAPAMSAKAKVGLEHLLPLCCFFFFLSFAFLAQ